MYFRSSQSFLSLNGFELLIHILDLTNTRSLVKVLATCRSPSSGHKPVMSEEALSAEKGSTLKGSGERLPTELIVSHNRDVIPSKLSTKPFLGSGENTGSNETTTPTTLTSSGEKLSAERVSSKTSEHLEGKAVEGERTSKMDAGSGKKMTAEPITRKSTAISERPSVKRMSSSKVLDSSAEIILPEAGSKKKASDTNRKLSSGKVAYQPMTDSGGKHPAVTETKNLQLTDKAVVKKVSAKAAIDSSEKVEVETLDNVKRRGSVQHISNTSTSSGETLSAQTPSMNKSPHSGKEFPLKKKNRKSLLGSEEELRTEKPSEKNMVSILTGGKSMLENTLPSDKTASSAKKHSDKKVTSNTSSQKRQSMERTSSDRRKGGGESVLENTLPTPTGNTADSARKRSDKKISSNTGSQKKLSIERTSLDTRKGSDKRLSKH